MTVTSSSKMDGHALNDCDFLAFEHTGNLHFDVVFFDKTMCEKQYLAECRNEQQNQDSHTKINKGEAEKKAIASVMDGERPSFTKEMTDYTATKGGMVNIPLDIVRPNNLATEKESVILRVVPDGKEWRVKLLIQHDFRGLRVLMRQGWHDFYIGNELKVGDLCLFELINPTSSSPSTTISFDVQIFPV